MPNPIQRSNRVHTASSGGTKLQRLPQHKGTFVLLLRGNINDQ